MGDRGVCGRRGDRGKKKSIGCDRTHSQRAGWNGRMHTLAKRIRERRAGGVCSHKAAVFSGGRKIIVGDRILPQASWIGRVSCAFAIAYQTICYDSVGVHDPLLVSFDLLYELARAGKRPQVGVLSSTLAAFAR